ncbi:hypothetical protein RHSIM_RhsimUnG0029700 [Rhododendron simsii]|uniref:DYW domain-containing protein n=1 Tax=Rhododendron simsii TaxID=118357 RepID=A0A834L526_RHOSS|nr:hypothetical protein RHSIM_RhsimUnG0029700 [Rhododendron simsii]
MVATTTTTTIAAAYFPAFPHSILSPHPPSTRPSLPYPSKPPSSSPISSLSLSLPNKPKPTPIAFSAQIVTNPLPQNHATSSDTDGPPTENHFNLLRTSVRYNDVELAKAVHASALKREEPKTTLSNALVSAYLKLGLTTDAVRVFRQCLSCPDVVLYSTMISGLAKSGYELEAVSLFFRMRKTEIEPNEFSFVAILTACNRLSDLELGFQVHSLVVKMGYVGFTYVSNALMGSYSKCGRLDFVLQVFDEMPERDVVSWNTMIAAVVKESMYDWAIELFRDMQRVDEFSADRFTLSTVLVACAGGRNWNGGRQVHAHGIRMGFQPTLNVNNALIDFYTKCGSIRDVETLFESMPVKDIITWTEMITAYMDFGLVDLASESFDMMPEKNCVSYNALLAGCCRNGEGMRALGLFCKMVEEGTELDEFTLTIVINACGLLTDMKISEQVHGFVLKCGFGSNSNCIESALIDMCTRCGRMDEAEKMFYQGLDNVSCPINWTSMICGYSRNGKLEEAISLFCNRPSEEVVVDEIALATVLGVCGALGYHVFGKQIHCLALKIGLLNDTGIGNTLTSMYCKCGNLEGGIKIFDMMSTHDTVSWNSVMGGHLLHRQGDGALDLWSKMEKAGLQPDEDTLRLVISAYGFTDSNLVEKCRILFLSMRTTYDIEPTPELYAAFVGVLGYWDLLEEAEQLINSMPFEPNATFWRALLDAGRISLNTRIGAMAAKQILALEPLDPSTYVLVANLYSASGRWQCAEKTREEMRKKGFRKIPSRSWIINENKVHSFYTRDERHFQSRDIYSAIDVLILECMKSGYAPDTSFVLQDVEEYQKKDFLYYHSAKLAATYGLLTTKRGEPIRVMKNVAICGDCHTFLKFVSVVVRREIMVRDSSGFHVFSKGQCSCKDYW